MWIFGRKGTSGFSGRSTAEEVVRGIDGSALTAIVTGASSGIGTETTRVLASCGVHVIMAVRDMDRGKKVKETIIEEIPDAKIDVMELDLASFASIRKFASEYKSLDLPLNILINNAGIFSPFLKLSQDNIEMQFATNHLGHFLLTNLVIDNMKKSARKSQREGRIINVSSIRHKVVHRRGIRFDKINNSYGEVNAYGYGQSKLANILHANELARRFKEEGVHITANSLHPGTVATNLLRHHSFIYDIVNWICKYFFKSINQAAATTCYVALHPQVKGVSGKYFDDCNISAPSLLASNAELGKKLWDFSLDLTQES